jgi:hypothetical protein
MKCVVPEAALNQHIAILGKTGAGKTWAAKTIVEKLLDVHRQVCVIDPTGAWWGLRLGADGKSRGFDVVLLGGKHADIPLAARSGEAVARLVTQQRASVVIDTTGLSVGEYTRWFIDFAGTLYTTIGNPLHVVIDEAHYFMPQGRVPDPEAGKMLHAGNRLMSGGRSLGIRGMLITQRPAKLHKDSLSCADTLIAMRVIAPQDRGAIKDWIDGAGDPVQGKAVLDSLAQLKRGEGWVWYPEAEYLKQVSFPEIKTYDSSATPTHGAKAGPTVSEIKLDEVRAAMAEAVKEAEANDPKLLRREISELKKQLSGKPTTAAAATDPKAIERAVAARDREWKQAVKGRDELIEGLGSRIKKAAAILQLNGELTTKPSGPSPQTTSGETRGSGSVTAPSRTPKAGVLTNALTHLAKSPVAAAAQKPASSASADGTELGKCERVVLQALFWLQGEYPSKAKVAFYAGYSQKSSGFDNAIGRLRTLGLAVGWRITPAGIEAIGDTPPKPTGSELRHWLRPMLERSENAVLDALIAAYPQRLSKQELADASGYSAGSSGFDNAVGKLRTLEAAEGYERDGGTKASDVFFE